MALADEFTHRRAKKIAERLSHLTDSELKRFREFTNKKEDRIARRLGFKVSGDPENVEEWRLTSLKPEELNAFLFTHIRILADIIESRRRYIANYRHQPHFARGPGRY